MYKRQGKYLHITNLGRVVTQLMEERFSDIADLKFTANMEKKLDDVEEGTVNWKSVLRDFYGDFEENLKKAEKDLEGVYIKVPDEVSEEICPVCGRNLVVKSGRFGRFLACPGFPECNFTMPLVVEMPGRCPKCGGRLFKRCLLYTSVYSGGDSLSVELKKRFDQFLFDHHATIQVREGYGLTECVTASCLTPYHISREGSIGIPLSLIHI